MRAHLLTTTAVMALLSASTVSTRAQTFWSGAESTNWFTAGNWTAGVPTFGTSAIINTLTPNATVIGNTGTAAAQSVVVGLVGAGSLTIQDRGSLFTLAGGAVGTGTRSGGRGDVTVTGPESSWNNINGGIQVGGGNGIGTLTVADGGLVIGSFSGGLITVGGGSDGFGVLRGNGSVTSTQISARGFLAPGVFPPGPGVVGTPGAMGVFGNLAFLSGAFYVVQVNPATASTTNVGGTASLAGTVVAAFAPGSYVSRQYTILTAAGGLTGTFDALANFGLPTGFGARLAYVGNSAILNLRAQLVPEPNPPEPIPPIPGGPTLPPPPPPFTVNQGNVGRAIDNFFNNGGTLPPAFVPLFGLAGSNLTTALDQISGEAATGAQTAAFQLGSQFLNLMLDPFVDGRCGVGRTDHPALGSRPECEIGRSKPAQAYASMYNGPISSRPMRALPTLSRPIASAPTAIAPRANAPSTTEPTARVPSAPAPVAIAPTFASFDSIGPAEVQVRFRAAGGAVR